MEKLKYLRLQSNIFALIPFKIHQDMTKKNASLYATVERWAQQFKLGRISVNDEARPGIPLGSSRDDNLDLTLDMVTEDRRFLLTCCQSAIFRDHDKVKGVISGGTVGSPRPCFIINTSSALFKFFYQAFNCGI